MGLGSKKTYGGKGDSHSFEHRNLLLLGELLTAITAAAPPAAGLATEATLQTIATEATLQTVSNTLLNLLAENKLDFELKSVVDTVTGDVYQLRGTLDEETGIFSWDYIDANGAVVVPVNPVRFLDPEGLLGAIEAELITLNATDFATAANQALAIAELQTLVTQTSGVATETTLDAQASDVAKLVGFAIGEYDEIDVTYIAAGNGAGEVGTVVYSFAAAPVATLTLTYDASNRLINVIKS